MPSKPVAIVFEDGTRCEVLRAEDSFEQANELQPLLEHCKPAPFGEGKKTRYHRKVRDALQLTAEKDRFSVENFDPKPARILKTIQKKLVPHDPGPISAELYSLNVYTNGGHFAPHKDTPRGSENCADETWQLHRFPTLQERAKLRRQVDSADLEGVLPIHAGSSEENDLGLTWLEPLPSAAGSLRRTDKHDDQESPPAAHFHSCEYCPWGYFGNEGSEVDFYTYAALHIDIPPYGRGPRRAMKPLKPVPAARKQPAPKRQPVRKKKT